MAGLLAWAADVVGGGGGVDESDPISIPIMFSDDEQKYVVELDQKAASLRRSIHDLRLRLPPQDISQSLPHLHAHSVASNAALALQLNSHSATRQQAQLREVTLKEENAAFENAISNCQNKIKEKLQEAELLKSKLEEMDETEKKLKADVDSVRLRSWISDGWDEEAKMNPKGGSDAGDAEALKSAMLDELEKKKKDLSSMEDTVRELEKKWGQVQENSLKQPSPAQREKTLDKQLHGLIEQLAVKQAQAEDLLSEIHMKEMELQRLNGLWRRLESSNSEVNAARNRFVKSSYDKLSDQDGPQRLPYHSAGRTESQQRLMLLRSAFVLYIFALHILVFFRISF
ncbi:sporulation-specific protein 15 [Gastrolobium bilobum]|uniref:sporulation-specific protein 15 n=1 Tax=Gastrolobium bilobum TaxID=150636 RepID=UPI002AB23FA7|nr:sporulation-specific protein 15 [Gastrolobium bilobum]